MNQIILEFPTVPLSLNQWLAMSRNFRDTRRFKRTLHNECLHSLHSQSGSVLPAKAAEPRAVKITVRRRRLLDHDNHVGGCKPLLDVLVSMGLLTDDRPSALIGGKAEYEQERAKGRAPMTRIEITW